jgi:hypothetical protein
MVANYDVADPIPIIDRDRKAGEPTSNKSLPLMVATTVAEVTDCILLPPCWCGSSAYQVRPPSTRIGSVGRRGASLFDGKPCGHRAEFAAASAREFEKLGPKMRPTQTIRNLVCENVICIGWRWTQSCETGLTWENSLVAGNFAGKCPKSTLFSPMTASLSIGNQGKKF